MIKNESPMKGVLQAQGYRAVRNGLVNGYRTAQWDFYKLTRGAWIRIGHALMPGTMTIETMVLEARSIDSEDE